MKRLILSLLALISITATAPALQAQALLGPRFGMTTPLDCGAVPGTVSAAQQAANATAIAACAQRSLLRHETYLIDNLYTVSAPINWRNVSYAHITFAGNSGFIQATDNVPLLQLGGQFVQVDGPMQLSYANQQGTTAAATGSDGVTGANALELWNFRRSTIQTVRMYRPARCLFLPQVDASGANSNYQFSNVFNTLDCSFFSYRGIELVSFNNGASGQGAMTGSVFNNTYIRGRGIGDRPNVNTGLVYRGGDEVIFNQLNFEHFSPGAVSSAAVDPGNAGPIAVAIFTARAVRIKSLHYEGIEPKANEMALLHANSNTSIDVDGMVVSTSYFLTANGATRSHVARMFGTNATIKFQSGISFHDNTATGLVDLGYASAPLTRGSLLFEGSMADTDVLTLTGNVLPTNDQKVLRGVGYPVEKWPIVGRYLTVMNGNAAQILTSARLYAQETYVPVPVTTAQLGFFVSTAQASSDCITGIYNHDGSNQPGTLIVQATAHTTTTAGGVRTAAVPSTTLRRGRYWMATACYNTAAGTMPSLTTVSQNVSSAANAWIGGSTDLTSQNASGSASSGVYSDLAIADAATWAAFTLPAVFPTATVNAISGTPLVAPLVGAIP